MVCNAESLIAAFTKHFAGMDKKQRAELLRMFDNQRQTATAEQAQKINTAQAALAVFFAAHPPAN